MSSAKALNGKLTVIELKMQIKFIGTCYCAKYGMIQVYFYANLHVPKMDFYMSDR